MNAGLAAAIAEVVVDLAESRSVSAAGTVTWSRGGREFAGLGPSGVEIRLDRAVASAATRTPDVAPSLRGAEWIRFSPRELDTHALDRLRAWLGLAYRRAGEPGSPGAPPPFMTPRGVVSGRTGPARQRIEEPAVAGGLSEEEQGG